MAPIKSNGSEFIYRRIILPWFLKNESKIEEKFARGKKIVDEGISEAEKIAKQTAADALTAKEE